MHRANFSSTGIQYIIILSVLVIGSIAGLFIGSADYSKLIIAGVLGVVFLIVSLTRPWIAVTLFFLLIPLENLFVLKSGVIATMSKLAGAYLGFLVLASGSLKYINEVFRNKKVFFILFFGVVALVSITYAKNQAQSFHFLITLWLSIILYFVLVLLMRDLKSLQAATLAILTGCVTSIFSPLIFGIGEILAAASGERYGGLWGDQNEFAAVQLILIPISIAQFYTSNKKSYKILYLFYSLILLVGLVMTYSRGGFLAFALMIVLAMFKFVSGKNRVKILAIAIPCIVIGFAVLYFTVADQFISRMETLRILESRESVRTESSLDKRYYYYFELAPQIFAENPVLGVGFRDFISHNIYKQISHNTYLEVLTGTGLLGFIPFITILFLTWKELRNVGKIIARNKDQLYIKIYANALELGFIGFLVAGSFISLDLDKMLWLSITLSAVLLNILIILNTRINQPDNKYRQADERYRRQQFDFASTRRNAP